MFDRLTETIKYNFVFPVNTMAKEKPTGKVTHFFDKISVAVVALDTSLKIGDKIKIGRKDNFIEQEVKSMQIEHKLVEAAKKGQEVGLKVDAKVKAGDLVYKA